ncbi:hypothetical protein [Acetobacterium bakii]|uniref:Lipocalin-like domain-containing protein n=1 Tax=Acetobacterium bakii TaxID=52689 RepID=A0A0L6U1M5_9FIRM|nr:hypothetical protein [Acetobacterium bakii]KNZ42404.1 hypothetical protein AKG39_06430 [Acetobacterium bakii]
MKIKKLTLIMMFGLMVVITSGCFATDLFKTPAVSGDWYHKDSNTYIALSDDGTFTMGYGKGNANTGGTYDYDKKEITLHLEYTVSAEGKKEDWDTNSTIGSGGKIVMPYELRNDETMKIKSEGGNLTYTKIGGEPIETTTENLIGSWKYEKGGLQLALSQDGTYRITEDHGSQDQTASAEDQGTYTFENGVLTLNNGSNIRLFKTELVMADRLCMENETGTFFYTRIVK